MNTAPFSSSEVETDQAVLVLEKLASETSNRKSNHATRKQTKNASVATSHISNQKSTTNNRKSNHATRKQTKNASVATSHISNQKSTTSNRNSNHATRKQTKNASVATSHIRNQKSTTSNRNSNHATRKQTKNASVATSHIRNQKSTTSNPKSNRATRKRVPRALPWADMLGPFGPSGRLVARPRVAISNEGLCYPRHAKHSFFLGTAMSTSPPIASAGEEPPIVEC